MKLETKDRKDVRQWSIEAASRLLGRNDKFQGEDVIDEVLRGARKFYDYIVEQEDKFGDKPQPKNNTTETKIHADKSVPTLEVVGPIKFGHFLIDPVSGEMKIIK